VFGGLGWPETVALGVLALFVFGPERLPDIAREAGKTLRKLRLQLQGMTDDLRTELGPELGDLDLASLHPKEFVRRALADDTDDQAMPVAAGRRTSLLPGEVAPWDPDTT
jgi:sec-independent protein translocase protein TatB